MERVRDGDDGDFGILVRRFWPRLVHFAAQILGAHDEAKDVVQEVFVRVWNRRTSWHSSGSVATYLYTITRNLSLNARRSDQSRAQREQLGYVRLVSVSKPQRPDDVLDETLLREEVESALLALSARRREVFVLARFHGLSYDAIADVLGLSAQTVANHMSSALCQLKELLSHRLEKQD